MGLSSTVYSQSSLKKEQQKTVVVGATEFPPYISVDENGKVGGILLEILDFFNSSQKKYLFKTTLNSAMRRHQDFKNGHFDVSFFDNVEWGWDKSAVDVSDVFMKGREIYIALRVPGRDQRFFQNFSDKTMVGILGYHYGFANYVSDPAKLRNDYNMQLTKNNAASIKMILEGRGDIAIVSDAYLNWYLDQHPSARSKLLISERVDQWYLHTVIVRKNTRPSIKEINDLLKEFKKSQEFTKIKDKYGVTL